MDDLVLTPMSEDRPLVRCLGITKFFGGVRAVARVSLDLRGGEIIGLVGDNGAGKSTLAKILSGLVTPDEGELWFGGTRVSNLTAQRARRWGVEMVYQTLELCDNLSAPSNVMLGQEPVRLVLGPIRFMDHQRATEETSRRLCELGITLPDLKSPVRRLSGGQRQAIAIARATVGGHRLVIFDEPTAALGLRQKEATWALIQKVAEQGMAVLVISHNLEEVFTLADRVVAMHLGEVTLDTPRASTTREEVRAHMSGLGRGNCSVRGRAS